MNLDAFKLAAKRLRKEIARLSNSGAQLTLSQSQALDTVARVLGYRDFHEACARLESGSCTTSATPNPLGENLSMPFILGIVGPPGCGKTLRVRDAIVAALADGIPVRLLETFNEGDYQSFARSLGAPMLDNTSGDEFLSVWRSPAPFVGASCVSKVAGRALDFTELALPRNALFVCDEARFCGENFKPLGGVCILVSRIPEHFPVEPDVTFVQVHGKWEPLRALKCRR